MAPIDLPVAIDVCPLATVCRRDRRLWVSTSGSIPFALFHFFAEAVLCMTVSFAQDLGLDMRRCGSSTRFFRTFESHIGVGRAADAMHSPLAPPPSFAMRCLSNKSFDK